MDPIKTRHYSGHNSVTIECTVNPVDHGKLLKKWSADYMNLEQFFFRVSKLIWYLL